MLRVATYNIQKSVGLDARRSPERILDVIAEIDPDVLAVQEIDHRFGERRTTLPPALIAARTDLLAVPFGPRPQGLGWHGNSILVRKSMRVLDRRTFDLPSLEPRGAVMATIDAGGVAVRVVSAHLSLVSHFRRKQAARILADLGAEPHPGPTVVMGDLNEWYPRSRSIRIFSTRFELAPSGRSFPAPMPVAALDRIMASRDLEISDAGVHTSRKARLASDHLPVWARLDLREPAAHQPEDAVRATQDGITA